MTWIGGSGGVVLGWGSSPLEAREDARDFCNANSDAPGLDILRATRRLAFVIASPSRALTVRYVVRDGEADLP